MPQQSRRRNLRSVMRGGAVAIEESDRYNQEDDERIRCFAHVEGKRLLDTWLTDPVQKPKIDAILALFDDQGKPLPTFTRADGTTVEPLITATAYNDLYKWTMMPVMRKMEDLKGGCTVTFGIDLRDENMRKAMREDPALVTAIHTALNELQERKFKRSVFTDSALIGPRTGLLPGGDIDAICGTLGEEKSLVDRVNPLDNHDVTADDITNNRVVVSIYFNPTAEYKPGETGVHFIEATGPWHRVTWLETSMMQCVYETKLRYDLAKKNIEYRQWLYGALLRCAKSVAYTREIQKMVYREPVAPGLPPPMTPALFTGRRTGGMAFFLLQNLFFGHHFRQIIPGKIPGSPGPDGAATMVDNVKMTWAEGEKTWCLGTSSCDVHYILNKMFGPGNCLNPAGTHAHELSMVSSALLPDIDNNDQHFPLTQVIGHYLYMKLVWERTNSTGPMPMLSDTLGTRAFLRAATYVKVNGDPFLNKITSGRQDSGKLADFKQNMRDFGYTKGMMASEIDDTITLLEAGKLGYASFGAGGFYGDSEKVWGNKKASSNSMAVKAVRVSYAAKEGDAEKYAGIPYIEIDATDRVTGFPVKIGDPENGSDPSLKEGKLSLDKNRSDLIPAIKGYAETTRIVGGKTGTPGKVRTSENIDDLLVRAGFTLPLIPVAAPAAGGYRRNQQQRRTRQRQQRQRQKQSRRQRQ